LRLREATIHSSLGHLQIARAGYFERGTQRPLAFVIDDPDAIESRIARSPGVLVAARRLNFFGLMNTGRGEVPIVGEGTQPDKEAQLDASLSILSGRKLTARDDFDVIVGEGLAAAMKVHVGDVVNLVTSTREGALNTLEFKIAGIFRTLSREYDARAVRVPLRAAQELLDTRGVTAIVVLLSDTDQTVSAAARISGSLPRGYEVKTWQQLADFYNATAAFYRRQFAVLQLIIVVLVLLGVANTVNMTLFERASEFGIIRALGRRSRDVFGLAVLETSLLGAVGAVLGVVLGISLALAISAIGIPMPPPPNSEAGFLAGIRIVPLTVLTALALGVLSSIAASLLPARKVARMPVVESLRRSV
jgi:putative ABC transport system permease protein